MKDDIVKGIPNWALLLGGSWAALSAYSWTLTYGSPGAKQDNPLVEILMSVIVGPPSVISGWIEKITGYNPLTGQTLQQDLAQDRRLMSVPREAAPFQ